MSRHTALQICANQGIEIKMREIELHLPRPVTAHFHRAVQIEIGIIEIRTAAQHQISAAGFSVDIRIAH